MPNRTQSDGMKLIRLWSQTVPRSWTGSKRDTRSSRTEDKLVCDPLVLYRGIGAVFGRRPLLSGGLVSACVVLGRRVS